MTLEEAIQNTPACPWCGSTHRIPSQAFTSKPNRYLVSVAQELGISPEVLIGKMEVVECTECGTSYCDPWLSPTATKWLFNLGYPQHNEAWRKFYQWLDRTPDFETKVFPRKERIWTFVQERIGPIRRYGEIGCPFMGLLAYFQCRKQDPVKSFARFQKTHSDHVSAKKHPFFVPAFSRPQQAILQLHYWKNRIRWTMRPPASATNIPNSAVPSDIYFVRSPSSLLWGGNCLSLSTSCAAMAMASLRANVVDLASLDVSFDVLAFFNTLDHQDMPLHTLEKAMDSARFVVIELHRDSKAEKQHLYVINEALARTAERRGWLLEEFSDMIDLGKGDRLYILSKDSIS